MTKADLVRIIGVLCKSLDWIEEDTNPMELAIPAKKDSDNGSEDTTKCNTTEQTNEIIICKEEAITNNFKSPALENGFKSDKNMSEVKGNEHFGNTTVALPNDKNLISDDPMDSFHGFRSVEKKSDNRPIELFNYNLSELTEDIDAYSEARVVTEHIEFTTLEYDSILCSFKDKDMSEAEEIANTEEGNINDEKIRGDIQIDLTKSSKVVDNSNHQPLDLPNFTACKETDAIINPKNESFSGQSGEFETKEDCTIKSEERFNIIRKPFSCTNCNKAIWTSSALKIHERTHTNEKPFSCIHCDKKFTQVGNLKTHERIHIGEKPYICSGCDKKFRT